MPLPKPDPIRSDLPQGTLDLLILKTIAVEPQHGWAISQRIQLVSSDAHDTVHRPPELAQAREFVSRRFGEAMAADLFLHHPAALVAGDYIGPPRPAPRRRWLPFWP